MLFRAFMKNDRGLSTVEYVIILALIAVGGIGAWSHFGKQLTGKIEGSGNSIEKELVPEKPSSAAGQMN